MAEVSINNKVVLVTGAAGFIGYHLCKRLLIQFPNVSVVGIDNLNDYYDVNLKQARLKELTVYATRFTFVKGDICDKDTVASLFNQYKFSFVVNLAAQAGVRYSIDNPEAYIQSNIIGFFNILEAIRHNSVEHFVFASSSSVYGSNESVPYSTKDKTDCPVSLYAATKKADELLSYSYAKLYGIKTTGLRFFTVYGPYGRPDMAYYKFTLALEKGESINLYNNGDMKRDFTYISDIITGVIDVIQKTPALTKDNVAYKIYNIGNNKCETLTHFVEVLEDCLMQQGIITQRGKKEFLPMQPGDVYQTYADVTELQEDFGFSPSTPLDKGLMSFVAWYKQYKQSSKN